MAVVVFRLNMGAVVWDMFFNSLKLFLKGKLFRDPKQVAKQWLTGFAAAAVLLPLLVKLGAPVWLAVAAVALGVGALQPWLFRDLKYA